MLSLNLPQYETKISEQDGKRVIFDILRKNYVALTPEEWVRQHFVHYLVNCKSFPAALMANEVQITLNGMKRRCDTVVYDNSLNPIAIIEYKAPSVKITKEVFAQIARYNLTLKVRYLIVSNGLQHYCCRMNNESNSYEFLAEIPQYSAI
ncbi:MAG: type I restriction enzyme HsdR N-terminal domain-containing protein [Bacteroidaceae bacterium]|nr:type I restriction enzyme HsdR N-terminal domain-containing protein [Bacteroidaceae bacterium]